MSQLYVRDFMSTPFHTMKMHASMSSVVQSLQELHVGALGVVENGVLKGIVSERDLVRKGCQMTADGQALTSGSHVEDIMTSDVITIDEEDHPMKALNLMLYHHIRHLPVVNKTGEPVGMLSMRDLVRHMLEMAVLI